MSNINLYQVYRNKLRKFGVLSSERFELAFIEAVNLVYAEFNDQVFQAQSLPYLDYFNDVIDTRLATFDTITMNDATGINDAIQNRELYTISWELERTNKTANGFTCTITDDASNIVFTVLNNVLTITGDTVTASATIPEVDEFTLAFVSAKEGNSVTVNGDTLALTYTLGDETSLQNIGTVTSHVVSGVTGYELKRMKFDTAGTVVYDFPIDEEDPNTNITDVISAYTALVATPQWDDRWVTPPVGLHSRYASSFDMGIDYHLQEGGEWALESIEDRERKWYGRGIRMARNVYQQLTTYTNPLGI